MAATLVRTGGRPVVRLQLRIDEPPGRVWERITEPVQLRAWFPSDVEVAGGEWTEGAGLTFVFTGASDLTVHGRVLEADEPRRLAFEWGDERLTFSLAAEGPDATLLTLDDEVGPAHAARNAAGWEACLDRLSGVRDGEPWRARFARYAEAFRRELGAQEGPPAGFRSE